jgi:hypothetical protein
MLRCGQRVGGTRSVVWMRGASRGAGSVSAEGWLALLIYISSPRPSTGAAPAAIQGHRTVSHLTVKKDGEQPQLGGRRRRSLLLLYCTKYDRKRAWEERQLLDGFCGELAGEELREGVWKANIHSSRLHWSTMLLSGPQQRQAAML